MCLRYFTSERLKEWTKWVAWAEYCYNTTIHSSTQTTSVEVVYGRPPPSILSYVSGTATVQALEDSFMLRYLCGTSKPPSRSEASFKFTIVDV